MRAHSFDVFDTCLVRAWARPVDVLEAVAERMAPGPPGAPGRAELVMELVRQRRAAETAAMEHDGVEAVVLGRIYADGARFRALGVDPAAMLEAELEVERASIRPVRAALERVRAARAAGLRVIFVSDMYLPAAEIRAHLEEHGFAEADDPLYVSGELGISKFTGRLFDHVLEREQLAPHELAHCGDDPITDDASPARRGIAVRPLYTGRPSRLEWAIVGQPGVPRAVASRLAGVARCARVGVSPEDGPLAETAAVAADAVAPLFAAFVAWVLRSARAEGIERLYFVSRDAQILLKVAGALRREGDPECRYLYGSRQAWFLPGVDAVDRRSLAWLTEPAGSLKTPRSLLAKLELAPEDVAGPLGRRDLDFDGQLDGERLERFWDALTESRDLVREHAAAARARLQRYLTQEGLYAPSRWALVDLGWRLTAQRALRRVLEAGGSGDAMLGFYLALGRNRAPLAETGPFRAFVLQDEEPGELPEEWLLANTSFVEQIFAMAEHGSCVGYRDADGTVEPVLREQAVDPARAEYGRCLHEAVVQFAHEAAGTGLLEQNLDAVRATALGVGREVVEHPTRTEAAALGRLQVGDDQNETRVRELAGPLSHAGLARMAGSRLGLPVTRDFGSDHVWRQGSLALSQPDVRGLYRGMRSLEDLANESRAALRRMSVSRRLRSARRGA